LKNGGKMKKILLPAVLLCVACLFMVSCQNKGLTGPAGAKGIDLATVALQNNYAYNGTVDTTIDFYSTNQNQNYSGDPTIWVGFNAMAPVTYTSESDDYARALLRFDLSTVIPSNGTIEDASLTLYPYNYGSQFISGTTTITAYAISDVWASTQATWINRQTSIPWTNPGGDYNTITAASDSVVLSDNNIPASVTFNLTASVVQGWLSAPSSNYGVIFIASNETITADNYFTFYSTNNGTISLNPILTLHYKLP
jgi:hypothetical protein